MSALCADSIGRLAGALVSAQVAHSLLTTSGVRVRIVRQPHAQTEEVGCAKQTSFASASGPFATV